MLDQITCTMYDRRWMRAGKAWRVTLALPDNAILAAALTALIDRKVQATIAAGDGITVVIDPAYVVDVPPKGKGFQLVIETCYEHQKEHGPRLTALHRQEVQVTLAPTTEGTLETPPPAQIPQATGGEQKVGKAEVQGLHASFFKNPRFQAFVAGRTGKTVEDEATCKREFKALHGVESCSDLTMAAFRSFLGDFNTSLGGKR